MMSRKCRGTVRRWLLSVAATSAAFVLALTPSIASASVSPTPDFTMKVHGVVYSVAPIAGRTIIGGSFTAIGSNARTGLGALWSNGFADKSFDPVLPEGSVVYAVAGSADGSIVYVGGSFPAINGVPRNNLAALDASTGAVIETWEADTDDVVRTLAVHGDRLYVGGSFTRIDGIARQRLAALDLSGNVIEQFYPFPSWTVRDLEVSPDGSKIYAVGGFVRIGGANRSNGAAELLTTTGEATSFDPSAGGSPGLAAGLSPDGTRFLFSAPNNNIWAYDPAVSNEPVWITKGGGDTQAIAVSPTGEVYVGGHFSQLRPAGSTGVKRKKIGSLWLSDGTVTPWNPGITGNMGPWDIDIDDTQIEVGGDFTAAGGKPTGAFSRFSGTP